MKDRIRKVREELGKSQEDLAKDLGLSRNYISLIENGQRNLSEQSQRVLCSLYSVNQDWLRNGTGNMYKEKGGSFTELLSELEESDDDFIKSLITVYMGLDEDSKSALRKIAKGMAEKYKSREN